jgi:hypothetical protein
MIRFCHFASFAQKKTVMKLKNKAWLISQCLLIVTALIIQLTFYREIQYGPFLGMAKRPYWEIIKDIEPAIPKAIAVQGLDKSFYDGRTAMTEAQAKARNLTAYKLAARQEEGLRIAFMGGLVVNALYLVFFHLLYAYFSRTLRLARARQSVLAKK